MNTQFELLEQIAVAHNFAEDLEATLDRYKDCSEFINNEMKKLSKKTGLLKGWRVLLLYLIITAGMLPIFCFFVLSIEIHVEWLYPIFTAILTACVKMYYEKKKIPIEENIFNRTTQQKQKELNELSSALMVYKEQSEQIFDGFPGHVQHCLALQILHEAIRQGYAHTITDAVNFYDKQLNKLQADTSNESAKIIEDIQKADAKLGYRDDVFKKFANSIN